MATLHDLDAATVRDWLAQEKVVLIDVREPWEYIDGRVPGALHLPMSSFDPLDVPNTPGKRPVFYCAGGIRSARAAEEWMATGPQEAYHLAAGFEDWRALGLPVEKEAVSRMGIQRQMGWVAGGLVALFTALTLWVHPTFSVGLFFIAGGQLLLGATGICVLQVVLGKMPWNQV